MIVEYKERYYVIQNSCGKFFSVNDVGFPCFVGLFDGTYKRYNTREEAQRFIESEYCTKMFKKYFVDATIKSVTIVTTIE